MPPSACRSLLISALCGLGPSLYSFANVAVGDPLEDLVLPTQAGGREHFLGEATANVFIFLKPGQTHTQEFILPLAMLQKEMAGKSVRWVAIVSERAPVGTVQQAGLTMPVLIDVGDELYGRLGLVLKPAVGIADQAHRLVAYQPYTKVNFIAVIRARLLHLLKEIDDEALERVLHPPAADSGGVTAAAHRRFKLAQKLFTAGQYAKALENVTISLQKDDRVAATHALRGQILAAMGEFGEARLAYDRALALDPAGATTTAARDALPAPAAKP